MEIMKKVNLEQLKYLVARGMLAFRDIKMGPGSFVVTVNIKGLLIQGFKFNPKYFNVAFSQVFTEHISNLQSGNFS